MAPKPVRKNPLAESLAQAEAGQGYFFASGAEFMDFLEKISKKTCRRKGRLEENAEDLAAFIERDHEPNIPLEKILKDMKKHGRL